MEKIFITGSKQCGTNFLLLLFTLLNFDTGFNKNDFRVLCYDNNTSETELPYDANHYILKNSMFIHQIKDIKKNCNIKYFIIPFRELYINEDSIYNIDDVEFHDIYNQSSELNKIKNDDISFNQYFNSQTNSLNESFNDNNQQQNVQCQKIIQMDDYEKIINYRNYIVNVITNFQQDNVPTLYLDYEGMMNNPNYLYLRLKKIFAEKNIMFNQFLKVYYRCCYYFKSKPDWYDWTMKWISSFN